MEKDEYEEPIKEHNGDDGPPRHIRPWDDDDEDDTNYFMSEPSISEAESSEYVRPSHIASLLAPRVESPPSDDASSKDLLFARDESPPPPPPSSSQRQQQQQQPGGGVAISYPNSPGTSLSSWDSPHVFHKQVQLYFSPEKTPTLEVPITAANSNSNNHHRVATSSAAAAVANKRLRRTSNQSTSSSSTNRLRRTSNQFLHDLKQYSVGAVLDARPGDDMFDSDRSNVLNGADRQGVDAVIRNVSRNPTTTTTTAQSPSTDAAAAAAPVIPHDDTDQGDETLVMDLSTDDEEEEEAMGGVTRTSTTTGEPLDWEAKHSADDEKTAGEARPRRTRKSPGSAAHRRAKSGDAAPSDDNRAKRGSGGHRRSRSGDAAAASLMTGGMDWKGMQFDQLPIPAEHDDEDEHDQSHDSREVASADVDSSGSNPSRFSEEAVGLFAIGSGGKNAKASKRQRRNQRVRRTMSREMNRRQGTNSAVEDGRMSRDAFSRYALESPRAVPKYVGRASPTNESLSTIEQYASERMESDSSGHGPGPRRRRTISDVNFNIPENRTHRMRHSSSDIYQPGLDHRVSDITFDSGGYSSFSWLSGKDEPELTGASWDPQYATYRRNGASHYQFAGAPELPNHEGAYRFGDGGDRTPDDTGSDDSRSDDATEDVKRGIEVDGNRLRYGPDVDRHDELQRLVEEAELRNKSHDALRHRLSALKNLGKPPLRLGSRASYIPSSHSTGDYPTFVCPVCKTRQREFFTASSAPSRYQGPAGYLALYFAIYVIAALFIFGLEEGWPALDCVYFAVITLTTAGLGDFVPTSDGAKILCSIFIYFGVACIGLLLGSYLASMLDEKSYKQAQRNRVENCSNCARLKNLRRMHMRRQRQEESKHSHQSSSIHAMRSVGFMSERSPYDVSHLGPHVLESEQKRFRSMPPVAENEPSSSTPSFPSSSTTVEESKKVIDPAEPGDTAERNSEKVTVEDVSSTESHEEEEHESQETPREDLEVIDSYKTPLDVMTSPQATPIVSNMSAVSPGVLGSPLTAQILGRQSHTRHMSFGGSNLDLTAERRFMRSRRYSEDLSSRPQFVEAIPEDNPIEVPSQTSRSQQSASEYDYDDESTETETTAESDDTLDDARRRIKTAKYVLLTLKQALVNSILIIVIGSLGFFGIEGMSVVDSFYFTTCLLTTVGYGDIVPLTSAGKLFATIYVLVAGTILLHNMSIISFIPLELRKRRIEQAVLTQFGDQLDDATLRELATGPLVQNLQLSSHSVTGLEECSREAFALAMLVRLGKVTESDIKQTFKAFRRLDVDNEGVLTTKSIIAGMVHKHRSSRNQEESQRSQKDVLPSPPPPPPPPPPFVDPSQQQQVNASNYWYGIHGSLHVVEPERDGFRDVGLEEFVPGGESELSSLMANNNGYDSFVGQRRFGGSDVEQGYARE